MAQRNWNLDAIATITGTLQVSEQALINEALTSAQKGSAAPPNPVPGMLWMDDSADPVWTLKVYSLIGSPAVATWRSLFSINVDTGKMSAFDLADPTSSGHGVNLGYLNTQLDSRPIILSRSVLATGGGTPAAGGEFQVANINASSFTTTPTRLFEVFCVAADGSSQRGKGEFMLNSAGEPQLITQSGPVNIAAGHNWASPAANYLLVGRESTGNKLVVKNTTTVDLRVFVRMT
jgi:hypothetical protein